MLIFSVSFQIDQMPEGEGTVFGLGNVMVIDGDRAATAQGTCGINDREGNTIGTRFQESKGGLTLIFSLVDQKRRTVLN